MSIETPLLFLSHALSGGGLDGITSLLKTLEKSVEARLAKLHIKKNHLKDAIDVYKGGNMALVLGAGASAERGILTWNTLLQELLIETIESSSSETSAQSRVLAWAFQSIFQPNPLIAARYLNRFYSKSHPNNPLEFIEQVRKNLYRGIKPSNGASLLEEIRQLCMAVGKAPNLQEVITYNFDDLLEEELMERGQGVKFKSIFEPGKHASSEELPIYHVHGYLPKTGNLTLANQVIFSEDLYHKQYADVYHWSNLVQINAFQRSNCLFVGTSLTDPNQRRLLDIAMKLRGDNAVHHYCIRRRYKAADVKKSLQWELQRQPDLMHAKIDARLGEDDAIEHLINITENYEEKDAASFGVGLIWVNEFKEYAEVLKRVREGTEAPMPGPLTRPKSTFTRSSPAKSRASKKRTV